MSEQDKREKVIKGLECCEDVQSEWKDALYVCPKCPYVHNVIPCETLAPLIRDALALLKAQEPVEPVPGLWDRDIQLYKCGACGGEIGAGGIAKYCFHCGRAVKWE